MIAFGFAAAMAAMLVISRRSLALGLLTAAVVLAAFSLPAAEFGAALWKTVTAPSVLLLAYVVLVIPVIAGTLEASGHMAQLVGQLRVGTRPFLALAPALLGMMPMPGGALLSAPLIEQGAGHVPASVKAAANVWFRHILLLVYPLGSSLIASASIAGLNVYATIPFLAVPFALSFALGWAFLLRRAAAAPVSRGPFSARELLVPLAILLAAPAIDLALSSALALPFREIATAVGVSASLLLAAAAGRVRPGRVARIAVRAHPWTYAAIVVAMFAFLNVFSASGLPQRLAAMALPAVVLCVGGGIVLGVLTGRVEAPVAVVLPIYASTVTVVSPAAFAVVYFAAFIGYVVTPVHPCVSVSLTYFGTGLGPFLRRIVPPAAVAGAVTWVVGTFVL